ncbi:hypothetical protein RHMOL_Rhmol06G0132100 [Rhododendron molle]|uniref:Uncharacterized protein n=3 Tax=Rhododendron molle TaxID=49168 RepID=A0ACC0ND68_RHOML|nr:hypothetical protein RHMOL_Rhmol06G0132100 [Rhododendron molle]KAI8550749.1 hypothetical protein RHMOL_Rhmol06G0132100 [Rhododendron molle]KAI8550750.1 hypothetical protein RHMOL_Rhmol06G0132100 [Rhododendron molle]
MLARMLSMVLGICDTITITTTTTCFFKLHRSDKESLKVHGIGTNRISKDINPGDWKSPICSLNILARRLSMSNMVSPFAIYQQQIAMLKQQQSLLMAAIAKSGGVLPNFARNAQPPGANGTTLPTPNWPNVVFQFPGMMIPTTGNNELLKYMQ